MSSKNNNKINVPEARSKKRHIPDASSQTMLAIPSDSHSLL